VGDDSFRNVSTSVFHFKQTDLELVGFGKTPSPDGYDKLEHLFASQGQLQIIETPFEDGAHVCTSTRQAVLLMEELKSLHENNFCHGDIRAYNCVFSDAGSHLIDFDFGGRAGTVTYPEGYRALLNDGHRIPETEDRAIQKWHDVYALVKLLLEFHNVIPLCDAENMEFHEVSPHCDAENTKLKKLMELNDNLPYFDVSDDELDKEAVQILDKVMLILQDKSISPKLKLEWAVKSTKSSEKETLGGFGGSPKHRKKE
jgi:serine/threonine protein kinase